MRRFAETSEAVAATTRKNEKVRLVSNYLRSLQLDDAARAAIFFTGRAFPRHEEKVLAVGGSLIWQALGRVLGLSSRSMEEVYRKHGDLGAMGEELLEDRAGDQAISLAEVAAAFEELARDPRPAPKLAVLEDLLGRASRAVAKYIIKIVTGDLRIGLKESLVEEAIAQAFARPPEEVRRAHMLTGDMGTTLRLAAAGELASARLRLFHPIGFMLASPAETPAEVMENFPTGVLVEDKYDGIRAQAHKSGQTVKLFSRTLDEIVEFPELLAPLAALPGEFILDGEIVAWRGDYPLPFTELQKRLGRKQPHLWLLEKIPVSYVAFDIPYRQAELLLDRPLQQRRVALEELLADAKAPLVRLARAQSCLSAEEIQTAFSQALERGQEGIMAKAPHSPYAPGRRGRFWLKLKQPLATLDVVVVAVEYGHGKRHGLLSDYTFAVRDADRLVTIGKAYSGLTDEEIRRLTDYFLEHTREDQGFRRRVEPTVVLEVAFNNIQRSDRHESGYALRFPRIVRMRPDKPVEEIDTVERIRELYRQQGSKPVPEN
jgi:DNA ligase 1